MFTCASDRCTICTCTRTWIRGKSLFVCLSDGTTAPLLGFFAMIRKIAVNVKKHSKGSLRWGVRRISSIPFWLYWHLYLAPCKESKKVERRFFLKSFGCSHHSPLPSPILSPSEEFNYWLETIKEDQEPQRENIPGTWAKETLNLRSNQS